jgi:hypothetical protein
MNAFQVNDGLSATGSSTLGGIVGGDFFGCFDLPDLLVFRRRCWLVAFRTFFDCLGFLRFFNAIFLTPCSGEEFIKATKAGQSNFPCRNPPKKPSGYGTF